MNDPSAAADLPPPVSPAMDAAAPSAFPLARRLTEEAREQEVAGLLQYFQFHPHLAEFLYAAAQENLEVLLLKGAALAETVYPSPGLRTFGDIDVLVRPEGVVRVRALLESLGYLGDTAQWGELVGARDGQANFFKHIPGRSIIIEVHTDLINNDLLWQQYRLDYTGVWERARDVRIAGAPARILGSEDQILHLCLHLAGHYLAAKQSLRDLDQVCRVSRVDWPFIITIAQKSGTATACFAGLSAASALLGTPIPSFVLDQLSPRRGRPLLQRFAAARAADIEETRTESLRFPLLWLLLETPQARLHAFRRLLLPSRHWLITHYYYQHLRAPDGPGFLYQAPLGTRFSPRLWAKRVRALSILHLAHFQFLLRVIIKFAAAKLKRS